MAKKNDEKQDRTVEHMINRRTIGAEKENTAIAYLEKNGMKIVAHNYRNKQGEIDIIGYHEGYLVFVEVKYRRDDKKGAPEEAVDSRKQRIICKVADYYRYCHNIGDFNPIRYDVVAICGNEINWYQNAFWHMGR
ncbi:MAG: YraN family protein [Lachnospiraceae bacterium]|nr:YraN family protein [Lachnospiraceae bacterium]